MRNKGFTYLGLILALIITLFICYKAFNLYFNRLSIDKTIETSLPKQDLVPLEHGINPGNYRSIVDTTKNKINEFEKQRAKTLEGIE